MVLSPGIPKIEFLDALDLSPRQRHCDSLQAGRRVGKGYLVVTFDRPHPSANTTPAATSSAVCVLMMDRNPPPLRPLTTEERTNEKPSVVSVFAVQPRVCAGKGRRGEQSAGPNHLQPEFLRRPRAFLARLEARNQPGGVRGNRRTSRTRFGNPPRSRRTRPAHS